MATRTKPSASKLLREAGPTMSIREAATILGIGKDTAYALAARDEFPTRVLRVGKLLRVPTADLRRLLGETGPDGGAAA